MVLGWGSEEVAACFADVLQDGGAVGTNFGPESFVAEAVAKDEGIASHESGAHSTHGGGGVVEGHALVRLIEALVRVREKSPTV